MKRLSIPVITLLVIFGMNSMATALPGGTYDFYGTYMVEQYNAVPPGKVCTLKLNGMSCPETTNFCIKNLDVTSNLITNNEPGPYYGIAIGIMNGGATDIDNDGNGPISLTVGSSGVDELLSTMETTTGSGGTCAAASNCVISHTFGYDPGGDAGVAGTVKGTIGIVSNANPTTYPNCSGGTGTYAEGTWSTGETTVKVTNGSGTDQTKGWSGTALEGSDPGPYTLKLMSPNVRLGGQLFGLTFPDTFGYIALDGTLCARSSPDSCIPPDFVCPAEDDECPGCLY